MLMSRSISWMMTKRLTRIKAGHDRHRQVHRRAQVQVQARQDAGLGPGNLVTVLRAAVTITFIAHI